MKINETAKLNLKKFCDLKNGEVFTENDGSRLYMKIEDIYANSGTINAIDLEYGLPLYIRTDRDVFSLNVEIALIKD